MKKEKERNLTLEQLEKKMDMAGKISVSCLIVAFIVAFICLFISNLQEPKRIELLCFYFIATGSLMGLAYTSLKIRDKYKQKIDTIKKQKKADEIRRLGQAGNIKDLVYIKDPEIIMHILSRGFTRIEIVDHTEDLFLVKIQLKGQDEFDMTTTILKKEFLALLYDNEKQELLDNLIANVEVETIKDENGERTKLQVAMHKGFMYTNPNVTDEELLQMLELRK